MSGPAAGAPAPAAARVAFAHAVTQHLADRAGIDVLHIKGQALDPRLADLGRGTDADVLVRPGQADRLLDLLRAHGWAVETTFEKGSPFGHATTMQHPVWANLDVHRLFPGIGLEPALAFDRLWADRAVRTIAGRPCPVPGLEAQRLLLVLNAARSGPHAERDLDVAWRGLDPSERSALQTLARELGAEVALAAATGDLDRYRGAPEYDLWRVTSQGGTRFEEWWARVRAAPDLRSAARVAVRATMVNTEHLATVLGHPPSRLEVAREFVARPVRGLREQWQRRRRPGGAS